MNGTDSENSNILQSDQMSGILEEMWNDAPDSDEQKKELYDHKMNEIKYDENSDSSEAPYSPLKASSALKQKTTSQTEPLQQIELANIEQPHKPTTPVDCNDTDHSDEEQYKNRNSTLMTKNFNGKPNSKILQRLNDTAQIEIQNKIKFDLLHSTDWWIRVCILLLLIIVILLCLSYAFGGTISADLALIQNCPGKTIEEIWQHSFETNTSKGTEIGCWTTSKTKTDISSSFEYDTYQCKDRTDDMGKLQFGVFLFFTGCCSCVFIYGLYTLFLDLVAIRKHKLYIKSTKFQDKKIIENKFTLWFNTDSVGNIGMMLSAEIWEIVIQTVALLFYNGYDVFDTNSVHLAHSAEFIILFAVFLAFNCTITAMLWFVYVFGHDKCNCNGAKFKLFAFFIDQICDLLYISFPFIALLTDKKTHPIFDHGDEGALCVLFGWLNIESQINFIFALFPIMFVFTKCLLMTRSAIRRMRNKSYDMWFVVTKVMHTTNTKDAIYVSQLLGHQINGNLNKEIYDAKGNLILKIASTNAANNTAVSSNKWCRICIVILATTLIVYAILIISLTVTHLQTSEDWCHNINATAHPQFYFYDECKYKVYPFTFSNNIADNCECRILRVRINTTSNLSTILDAVFTQWTMLEKFEIRI
eukprot:60059_1